LMDVGRGKKLPRLVTRLPHPDPEVSFVQYKTGKRV